MKIRVMVTAQDKATENLLRAAMQLVIDYRAEGFRTVRYKKDEKNIGILADVIISWMIIHDRYADEFIARNHSSAEAQR